ncbi:MAG: hypothetical protein JWR69_1725 [Pedosphaera sp.]|nr:hypothetical protein [Pedosphaera sp.]
MGEFHLHEFKIVEASVQAECLRLNAATDKPEPLMEHAGWLIRRGDLQRGKANPWQAARKGDEVLHELTADGAPAELRQDIQTPQEHLVAILWVELAAEGGNTSALLAQEAAEKENAIRFVSAHAGLKLGEAAKRLLLGQRTNELWHVTEGVTADLVVSRRIGRL